MTIFTTEICRTHFFVRLKTGVDVPDVRPALRPCMSACLEKGQAHVNDYESHCCICSSSSSIESMKLTNTATSLPTIEIDVFIDGDNPHF